MIPYVIWAPSYTPLHGGVRALHKLKDELIDRGQIAFTCDEYFDPQSIAIYPEIINHNALGAPHAIYWLLNKSNITDETIYAWETGMGEHPLLTVDIIEPIWHDRNLPRKKIAWWAGKGYVDPSLIPDGAEEIHRANHPDRTELAEYVASLDHLISFDPFTSLNIEAAVSGTPVLVHSINNQWTREDFTSHGWVKHGIAWEPSEMDSARENVHLAAADYDRMRGVFGQRVDAFIAETQEMFTAAQG